MELDFDYHDAFTEANSRRLGEALPRGLSILSLNLNRHGDVFLQSCNYARIEHLHSLSLPNNHISEAGLQVLIEAFTNLRFDELSKLNLRWCHVQP